MGGLTTELRISTDTGTTFSEVPTLGQVRALAWSGTGELCAGANNWADGLHLLSAGIRAGPGAGSAVLSTSAACINVRTGRLAATHGNDVVAACEPFWPALVELFGIGSESPDGGTELRDAGSAGGPSLGGCGCPDVPPHRCGHHGTCSPPPAGCGSDSRMTWIPRVPGRGFQGQTAGGAAGAASGGAAGGCSGEGLRWKNV
jgi:hypothetical protein